MTRQDLITCDRADWVTPPEFLDVVKDFTGGRIGLDPCAGMQEHADWNFRYPREDGLAFDWAPYCSGGLVYVNPPYGGKKHIVDPHDGTKKFAINAWMAKCNREHHGSGVEILGLVAASTGAKWFQREILGESGDKFAPAASAGCFWRGRLPFVHPGSGKKLNAAPFWSFVPYWGPHTDRFEEVFGRFGVVARLNLPPEPRKSPTPDPRPDCLHGGLGLPRCN